MRIIAQDFYSAFLLQARRASRADGNAALVGTFQTIPAIAEVKVKEDLLLHSTCVEGTTTSGFNFGSLDFEYWFDQVSFSTSCDDQPGIDELCH